VRVATFVLSVVVGAWPLPASASASYPECTLALSKNCSCVTKILDARLGQPKTQLLVQTWLYAFERDEARRERFFRERGNEVSSVVLEYGAKLKDFIAFECGTLDFNDDIY
jgi:hypothetical protein